MTEARESIEGIGGSEFVDGDDAGIGVRQIPSGRGRLDGGHGKQRELEPELICGPEGRLGWRVKTPGGRPLATPACVDGRVHVGGGFGSHDFYSFDAATGKLAWRLRTSDDGPTAAVVAGDLVVFNTESCTLVVAEARTGKVVWEKWLGDPLMAQPAIAGGTVYMAFPCGRGKHSLAAFDLAAGKEAWRSDITADVITAPVIDGGSVYATTLDGTVYHFDRETGQARWAINHQATSAPWIFQGRVFMSLREETREGAAKVTVEGIATAVWNEGLRRETRAHSRRRAAYFAREKEAAAGAYYAKYDASVGFASAPSAANLHMASAHLGLRHVASVWSFQGSRPEVFEDGIFSVLDEVIQKLDLETKKPLWRSRLQADGKEALGRILSPPAVTATRLYLTTALGDLIVLDRATGDEVWALNVGSPILSQPAVAGGKVYLGTADGVLYAFETGDDDLRGWQMWGGGPGHNGPLA